MNFYFFVEDMPERLHYKNNRRIADVIISALEGVGFIYVGKEPIQVNHNGRLTSIVLSKEHKRKLMLAAADKAIKAAACVHTVRPETIRA